MKELLSQFPELSISEYQMFVIYLGFLLILSIVVCISISLSVRKSNKLNAENVDRLKGSVNHFQLEYQKMEAKSFSFKEMAAAYKLLLDEKTGDDNRVMGSLSDPVYCHIQQSLAEVGYKRTMSGIHHEIDVSKNTLKLKCPHIRPEAPSKHIDKARIKRDEDGNFQESSLIGIRHEFKEGGGEFTAKIHSVLSTEVCGKVIRSDAERYYLATGKDRRTVYFNKQNMVETYVEAK